MTVNNSAATQKDHIVVTVRMGLHQTTMEGTASVCEEYSLCNNAVKTSYVVNHRH